MVIYKLKVFQSVFKAGCMYFLKKKGICLSFNKYNLGCTPFETASAKFGRDEAMKIFKNTIVDYYSGNDNNIVPYNPMGAFLTAVYDKNIRLDGAYFFLRRHPDILERLLSTSAKNNQ